MLGAGLLGIVGADLPGGGGADLEEPPLLPGRDGSGDGGPLAEVGAGVGPELGFSQSVSIGGGSGVVTVLVLTSPMMASASLLAWYIRNISSLLVASSADSSIN